MGVWIDFLVRCLAFACPSPCQTDAEHWSVACYSDLEIYMFQIDALSNDEQVATNGAEERDYILIVHTLISWVVNLLSSIPWLGRWP